MDKTLKTSLMLAALVGVTMALTPSVSDARGRQPEDQATTDTTPPPDTTTDGTTGTSGMSAPADSTADPAQTGAYDQGQSPNATDQGNSGPRMNDDASGATGGGAPANNP